MKKTITLLALVLTTFASSAQDVKYSDLSSMTKGDGKLDSYTSKDGIVFKLGDTVTVGVPSGNKTFNYIEDGSIFGTQPATSRISGNRMIIKRIWVSGTKRQGFQPQMKLEGVLGTGLFIKIEEAIATGEIKSNQLTPDQALVELKKWKDKLDLGLVTQEEYEAKKAELSKIILKN